MPQFKYTARDRSGELVTGSVSADSQRMAIEQIRRIGCAPIKIDRQDTAAPQTRAKRSGPAADDVLLFTKQLARLLESKIPVSRALDLLSENSPSDAIRNVAAAIHEEVRGGSSLSDAMTSHPRLFPELYTGMIRSGEASGTLPSVLRRLADHLERRKKMTEQVVNALMYPAFMLGIGIITVIFLIAFVIPRFQKIFEDIGQAMPLPTQILMSAGSFMGRNWWILLGIAVFALIALRGAAASAAAKISLHRFFLSVPVAGRIFLLSSLSRFSRVLGTLLQNGIPILSALELASENSGNLEVGRKLEPVRTGTREGVPLSSSLRDTALFDAYTIDIITVAEETGELPLSLIEIAGQYEEDVLNALQRLTAILQPALIVILGLIVAFVVSAMLLPILQLNLSTL